MNHYALIFLTSDGTRIRGAYADTEQRAREYAARFPAVVAIEEVGARGIIWEIPTITETSDEN